VWDSSDTSKQSLAVAHLVVAHTADEAFAITKWHNSVNPDTGRLSSPAWRRVVVTCYGQVTDQTQGVLEPDAVVTYNPSYSSLTTMAVEAELNRKAVIRGTT